ncbi:MAG: class I SAM-dependent methyltransferase [Opitutaceae bacterium]|nr:class I SAM-dependent methyltransferase [Opitutaceae bacterium]
MLISMSSVYDTAFFLKHQASARSSADVVVPHLVDLVRPACVLDLGCGLGTWLAAFRARGVAEVCGVDGEYVQRELLEIPSVHFVAADLTRPLDLGRRFDLALSLEVAEHLDEGAAPVLVDSLIRHAPVVAFSAAVPGQGGEHHVNCRWPDYWAELFRARGYEVVDCLRPVIWGRTDVDWWYQQNLLLFVERRHLAATPRLAEAHRLHPAPRLLARVHPCLLEEVLAWGMEQARARWSVPPPDAAK